MNRVFVVQENGRADYSDAERFGELVFMTVDEFKPVAGSLRNENIKDEIRSHLSSFDDSDYLVLTGNPIMIGYAFHYAVRSLGGAGTTVNILKWDKMDNRYKPYQLYIE